jgi:long-chain acyl-CoA synthetase
MVPQLLEHFVNVVDSIPAEQQKKFVIAALGGTIKELIIGGAALSKNQLQHIIDIGIPLSTCYGITECGPTIAFALSFEYKLGTSGIVIDGLNVRTSPAGEILVKGDNVMLGYYKDPEATAAKIDKDGWLHTGDIGRIDADGYVWIVGRASRTIVLSSGKKVAPEELEAKLLAIPGILEAVVSGEGETREIIAEVYGTIPERAIQNSVGQLNLSLPVYKRIKTTIVRSIPFPRTASGKIKVS